MVKMEIMVFYLKYLFSIAILARLFVLFLFIPIHKLNEISFYY